ncbi:MAG: methyltransferase domain-containing protein [Planctomycetota bacterium]|nr:methyltransferase domain-containing protein [Planctomycetota bacterium]
MDPSTQQYIQSLWVAEDYDDYFALNALFQFDTGFLDRMLRQPGKLLDVGCGTGRHLVHFVKKGFEVTGVDLSDAMLRIVEEKLGEAQLSASLLKSDICDIPHLGDETFDAAICMFSTLGMVRGHKNRMACMHEVFRVLKPKGIFIFHCHNFLFRGLSIDTWHEWFRSYLLTFRGYEVGDKILDEYRTIKDMYLHTFRPSEIRRMVTAAGFQLEYFGYLNADRSGELPPIMFRALRANGFVIVARKGE